MSYAEIKSLREKQANIATEARAKFEEIKDDTAQERAAEIETEFDAMMADHDKIGERAERLEKLAEVEKKAKEAAEQVDERKRPSANGESRGADEGKTMEYRQAFHEYLASNTKDGHLSAEARQVLESHNAELRAQTTTNTAGGYSVPEQMMERIVVAMKAWGPMYDPGVTGEIVTTGGNPMPFPTVDDTGVTAENHTEGATLTDDGGKDITFGTKQLDAFAYNTEWVRVSKEIADDSFAAMEQFVGGRLGERLARIANAKLTTGTGSNEPNGIMTATSAGVTAASATAITWDETIDLEHSVDPAYRNGPNVGYMFNDDTLKVLRKLKDGDGNYLWQMGNVQAGIPATFNGRSYTINQDVAAIATGARVMAFGDMSKYLVRKVGQPLVGAISDKDFWPGFGVAGYIRFDGELEDNAAIKHLVMA